MPRITIFDPQGIERYTFPLNSKPIQIGNGDACDYSLPGLPAGPQLLIEWNEQRQEIHATSLTPECPTLLGDRPLGSEASVWPPAKELRVGTYRLSHDLRGEIQQITGDGFDVSVHSTDRYLALTPGRENSCLVRIHNHSKRDVDASLSVLVDGRSVNWATGVGRLTPQFEPNENREVRLGFIAPRSSAQKAGQYQATITAASSVDQFRAGKDSITLLIERFFDYDLKVERMRRFAGVAFHSARFKAKVTNKGNCPDRYELVVEPGTDLGEYAQCSFSETDSAETELEIEPTHSSAAELQIRLPLLWIPLWKRRSFNVRAISPAQLQTPNESGRRDVGVCAVRFTQFSVLWLFLATILVGWLAWQAVKVGFQPEFGQFPSLEPAVSKASGMPGDPIEAGDAIKITWKTNYADWVDIFQVGDNDTRTPIKKDIVATLGKYEIEKGFDRTVTLIVIARNRFGQAEKEVPVPVRSDEAMVDFDPRPPRKILLVDDATDGPCVNISWEVKGRAIRNITFDGAPVRNIDSTCKPVSPPFKEFELRVNYTNRSEPTVKKYLVLVATPTPLPTPSPTPSPTPPRCLRFRAEWPIGSDKANKRSPYSIKKGDTVELQWEIKGADSIRVMESVGSGTSVLVSNAQATGSYQITPERTTRYSLITVKAGQETSCNPFPVVVLCRFAKKTPPFYEWKECK